jgi:hypothetical protein
MKNTCFHIFLLSCVFISCYSQTKERGYPDSTNAKTLNSITQYDTSTRTIHVFVALCDNKYQGIVPVPEKIGNGQDPDNNLYWGCSFGTRTWFRKSAEWKLVQVVGKDSLRLERLIFKHSSKNYYLVADAYNGQFIEQCTREFLYGCSGQFKDTLHVKDKVIGIAGNAKLVAYCGHDGLMDFDLEDEFKNADGKKRDAIVLACYSKKYFNAHLKSANVNPLVWTTGLMCPEAYTLHDAITGYLNNERSENIRLRAANAYAQYQKCTVGAAKGLLVTGW